MPLVPQTSSSPLIPYGIAALLAVLLHAFILDQFFRFDTHPKPAEPLPLLNISLQAPPIAGDPLSTDAPTPLNTNELLQAHTARETESTNMPDTSTSDILETDLSTLPTELVAPQTLDTLAWDVEPHTQPTPVSVVQLPALPPPSNPGKTSKSKPSSATQSSSGGSSSPSAPSNTGSTSGTSSGSNSGNDTSSRGNSPARYKYQPLDYPEKSRQRGDEGTVYLRVSIDEGGRPTQVSLHQSCGIPDLDQAALNAVRTRWTFHPALRDNAPIPSESIVPVIFSLKK